MGNKNGCGEWLACAKQKISYGTENGVCELRVKKTPLPITQTACQFLCPLIGFNRGCNPSAISLNAPPPFRKPQKNAFPPNIAIQNPKKTGPLYGGPFSQFCRRERGEPSAGESIQRQALRPYLSEGTTRKFSTWYDGSARKVSFTLYCLSRLSRYS